MLRFSLLLILFIDGNALWLGKKLQSESEESSNSFVAQAKIGATFFDFGSCLASNALLSDLARNGATQCQHVFSCNNFWANEVQLEISTGTYCFLNAYERNIPAEARIKLDAGYTNYLRTFVTPLWELYMKSISMVGRKETPQLETEGIAVDVTGMLPQNTARDATASIASATGFVQTDKCDGEQLSGGDQLKCMMTQLRGAFDKRGGSPNSGKLSMSTEQAADMKGKLQRVHSSMSQLQMSQKLKMQALEQGPGDLSGMEFGPEDDVPVAGPIENSLTATEPKTTIRYGHAQQGLKMQGALLTDIDPLAKCNDGSPALYYLSEGSSTQFHLHLGGGYFCYNARNCRKRVRSSPQLGSSRGYEMEFTGSGIFDPVNGGLPGWTHGTFTYCSSDAFYGQMDTSEFQVVNGTYISPGVTGSHFRGYTMIEAMLRLYVRKGLGSAAGHELIISGCSAGSVAVTGQADSFIPRTKKLFQQENPTGTWHEPSIVVVSDNMPIISPQPVTVNFNGRLALFDQVMELVNHLYVKPGLLDKVPEFLNANCAEKFPENVAACTFPEQVQEYVQSPNLILNNLMDTFILFNPAAFFQPSNAEQEAHANLIQEQMRTQIQKVAPKQNQWAINCNDHCFSLNPWWWRLKPVSAPNGMHNVSPRDMMQMTQQGTYQKIAMDDCRTFDCGCIGFAQFYQGSSAYQVSLNLGMANSTVIDTSQYSLTSTKGFEG